MGVVVENKTGFDYGPLYWSLQLNAPAKYTILSDVKRCFYEWIKHFVEAIDRKSLKENIKQPFGTR